MTIEHLQVQFSRDGDDRAANVALEVKDDQNKSNDHHQIRNTESESKRWGNEQALPATEMFLMNLISQIKKDSEHCEDSL